MLYLIATTLFMSLYALLYKVSSHRGCSPIGVNLILYLSAMVITAAYLFLTCSFTFNLKAALLGCANGVFMFVAVLAFFIVAIHGDLSTSWTIINLSIVIPIGASILLWKEIPNPYQIAGILLVIPSLMLFGNIGNRGGSGGRKWMKFLLISFVATGLSQTLAKAVHEAGVERYKAIYMLFSYGLAFILTSGLTTMKGMYPKVKDDVVGSFMGLFSVLTVLFFLLALEKLRGIVVFPVRSSGNLVLTTALSCLVLRERIDLRKSLGIFLAGIAIVLINIRF